MFRSKLLSASFMLSAMFMFVGANRASADVITFESYSGPSVFGNPEQTLTINGTSAGTVTISGGTILTAETNLPADESSLYGTCSPSLCGVASYLNTITLTFQNAISNFFVSIYNGEVYPDDFTASDNLGNTVTQTLNSNDAGGNSLVSFAAAGTQVTITTADTAWDFSIDNVGFNEATPGSAPEPGTVSMMLVSVGLVGLVGWYRRQDRQQGVRSSF